MRTVTFGAGTSLDGFIARPDHGVDWLRWSDEVGAVSAEYWKTIDTVVMGRKTYEVALRSGTRSYPGVKNYVFSRSLPASPDPAVELVRDDAAAFVAALKRRPGAGICVMGGGELAAGLFAAGVIDEVGLNVHPVVLGAGIPLFHPAPAQMDLELVECRRFETGCVLLRYAVKPPATAPAP